MTAALCIDWGNTRIKAGVFVGDQLVKSYVFSEQDAISQVEAIIEQYTISHAILSSVVNNDGELIALLSQKVKFIKLTDNTRLPIINAYSSPKTLGADRIACVVGANNVYPHNNCLIICVGTAITYNFITKNLTFRGGNITPGIHLRFKSLNDYTDKLPYVSVNGDNTLLGYDTETSIRSGVIWGITAEIDGMIDLYKKQFGEVEVMITGGDSSIFASKIKNKTFADENLLLKGLYTILKYNV